MHYTHVKCINLIRLRALEVSRSAAHNGALAVLELGNNSDKQVRIKGGTKRANAQGLLFQGAPRDKKYYKKS